MNRTSIGKLAPLVFLALTLIGFAPASAGAQSSVTQTKINAAAAKRMLLGQHRFSLQWISWDYFGKAVVTEKDGLLTIKAEQKGRGNDDYVRMEGIITRVDAREFIFEGRIVTRVSHINNGEPCERQGEMTFRATGTRRYWRLQEMNNPCDEATDYVDIFFR